VTADRGSRWPASIFDEIAGHPDSGITLVIDPDDAIDDGALRLAHGDVVRAATWLELRRAYELLGRHRESGLPRLVVHLVSDEFHAARDLPWDIEQASRVLVVRFPARRAWLGLWRELDQERRRRLLDLLAGKPEPSVADVLVGLFGVVLPQADPAAELDATIRLRLATAPPALWSRVRPLLRGEFAVNIASDPPAWGDLQVAWDDWLREGLGSRHHDLLAGSAGPLVQLLQLGLLRPSPKLAVGLPAWVDLGAEAHDPLAVVRQLLDEPPDLHPGDLDGWGRVASWWGQIRAGLAEAAPVPQALSIRAWSVWAGIDASFRPWRIGQLGMLQTSARPVPPTVDKVAPFLARRLRAGTPRILLIVMDGMGFAQWATIRGLCGLTVLETATAAACVPTLTPFSRQAIFAGAPPTMFADTLENNESERSRWQAFWGGEGIANVTYHRTPGATEADVPELAGSRVVGIAVLAVDDMIHGAKLNGDAEVQAGLRSWASHGFLSRLVERATADGYEVWITADHGNLEVYAVSSLPKEGLRIDRPGQRVRLYASAKLRDEARASGIPWDPPGLPPAHNPLFANGREAYVTGDRPVVVHGGISLDEVLVPLVRVSR
jgi:hypothetical protein